MFKYPDNVERAIKRLQKERLKTMLPNSEEAHDYYSDHYDEIAEEYFNDDKSGDLSLIGEFVLNNPKLFTLFIEEWAALPENEDKIRAWFMSSLPQNDEHDVMEDR